MIQRVLRSISFNFYYIYYSYFHLIQPKSTDSGLIVTLLWDSRDDMADLLVICLGAILGHEIDF